MLCTFKSFSHIFRFSTFIECVLLPNLCVHIASVSLFHNDDVDDVFIGCAFITNKLANIFIVKIRRRTTSSMCLALCSRKLKRDNRKSVYTNIKHERFNLIVAQYYYDKTDKQKDSACCMRAPYGNAEFAILSNNSPQKHARYALCPSKAESLSIYLSTHIHLHI